MRMLAQLFSNLVSWMYHHTRWQLEKMPYTGTKARFQELQHRYQGQFPDGQLPTFQCRVKNLLVAQVDQQNAAEMFTKPYSSPEKWESWINWVDGIPRRSVICSAK